MATEINNERIEKLSYSIREVTEVTGLSKGYIHKLFNDGFLTRRKIGKRTFVLCDEVRDFLHSRPSEKWRGGEGA